MRRSWIMLLAVVLALVVALPAGAGKPDNPGKPAPDPDPEIWTCKERVANGATWELDNGWRALLTPTR